MLDELRSYDLDIFDVHGRFSALKSIQLGNLSGSLRSRVFEFHFLKVTRRVVTPKSNTGRGAIAQTNAAAQCVFFGCSRPSGARTRSYFEKSSGLINSNMSWLGPVLI